MELPRYAKIRQGVPTAPSVNTQVQSVAMRKFEYALLTQLPWPKDADPRTKATCVRVMATQLVPLMTEYTQLRDHHQEFLGQLDAWHADVLLPHLNRMAETIDDLKQEVQSLKLRTMLHGLQGASLPNPRPSSIAPSLMSARSSVAESIAEAQKVAAACRGQGPAMEYPKEPGPIQEQAWPHAGEVPGPNHGASAGPMTPGTMPEHPPVGQVLVPPLLPAYIPNQNPDAVRGWNQSGSQYYQAM